MLGTTFDVNAYPESEQVVTTLTSGKIEAVCQEKAYRILPGEQIRNYYKTGKVEIREVNTEMYTSWKDGYYYFEACPLETIMETLCRWYGVQVVFTTEELKEMEYSGRLRRYESIEQWFRKFEQTRNVRFERKGKTVVVSR